MADELGMEVVGYETGPYCETSVTGVDEAVALLRTMGPRDALTPPLVVTVSPTFALNGSPAPTLADSAPSHHAIGPMMPRGASLRIRTPAHVAFRLQLLANPAKGTSSLTHPPTPK
jgi:hypothetical protein